MLACEEGDLQQALALLAADPACVNVGSPKTKMTALHLASYNGSLDIVDALLAHGANAGAKNNFGDTPILMASCSGHLAIVVRLLMAVARPTDGEAASSASPTSLSEEELRSNLLSLVPNARKLLWTELSYASEEGMNCFLHACQGGHPQLIRFLLDLASQISQSIVSSDNEQSSVGSGDKPADATYSVHDFVNLRNQSGSSALHFAISACDDDIINLLLSFDIDPNAETEDGYCPLLLAIQEGSSNVVAALLKHGADPNARDSWTQNSALHAAIECNRVDVVEMLLQTHKCDVKAVNKEALTPVTMARSMQNEDVIKLLDEYAK
jgi:ankyrin repeat protein